MKLGLRRPQPCASRERPAESPESLVIATRADPASVPVYSVRNPLHHESIARALAAGHPAAFYVGLYGIGQCIRPAWDSHDDAETYWRIKDGRPRWAKVPMFIRPQHALRLIDFRLVHPDFRFLAHREQFEQLWSGHRAPLHVIAPLKTPLRFLHPALITLQCDLLHHGRGNAISDDAVNAPATACFFWIADPMWERVIGLSTLYGQPRVFSGASSLNDHGEQPPYTFTELQAFAQARGEIPFDLVINDELYERSGAYSSHTQVRLPLVGESPELVIIRRGCITPEWLADSTGFPVRVLPSASVASRRLGISDAELQAGLEQFRRGRISAGW